MRRSCVTFTFVYQDKRSEWGGGAAWVRASARRPRLHAAGLIANSGPGFIRRIRPSEAGLPVPFLGCARAHVPLGCGCLPLWFGMGLSPSRMPFSSGFSFAFDREQRARFHKADSTERGGSSSALPWVRTYARASGMWVSPPLVWDGALSVANAIFIWLFFCVLSKDPVRCAVHGAAPSCPGRTCASAYARAEMRMRVPPPLVRGRALSVATVCFVWFFFCGSSQYLVRCVVHSAAPSRPGGTRTCAYARRARARAEMRDVSGREAETEMARHAPHLEASWGAL